MATVPKYTRTLYQYNYPTQLFVGTNRTGTTIGNATYLRRSGTGSTGYNMTIDTGYWYQLNQTTFHQGATFSAINFLKQSVFDDYIDKLKTFIFNGSTGHFQLCDRITDPKEIIMYGDGSAYSSGFYFPNVDISITRNELDGVSGERYITGQWFFEGCRAENYNISTNKFTNIGHNTMASGNINRSTTYQDAIYKGLQVLFDKFIRHTMFLPGPNPVYSTLASGDLKVTDRRVNQTAFLCVIKGCEFEMSGFSQKALWRYINAWAVGGNWTADGQIDPTDPDETPTPPVPPDPDPVPTPDPWFPDPPNPDPSDNIEPPDPPPIGGVGTGFYHVYNPTTIQLRLIASDFWTANIWQQLINYFTNPMETIIGLGIIPVKPTVGDEDYVKFGLVNSSVKAPVVTSDYKVVDCGSRYLAPYYNSYLDYEPYTKMSMYIPYIGEFDLNPDEVTGKTVRVFIYINVTTGDLVGIVTANGTIVYTAGANCFRQLPVTQSDMSQIIQAAISAVTTIASASAGGAAGVEAGAISEGYLGAPVGDQIAGAINSATSIATGTPLVGDVMASKLHYHRAGQIGTGSGQLTYQKPYLTILRPNLMLPDGAGDEGSNSDLKAYKGYPCNRILPLTNATGMTVLEDARLSIPGATQEEVAEALQIMKGGYIA